MSTRVPASPSCRTCILSVNTASSCERLELSRMRNTKMHALLKTLLQKIYADLAYQPQEISICFFTRWYLREALVCNLDSLLCIGREMQNPASVQLRIEAFWSKSSLFTACLPAQETAQFYFLLSLTAAFTKRQQ